MAKTDTAQFIMVMPLIPENIGQLQRVGCNCNPIESN